MKWHRDNRHVPSIFVSFCQLCLVVVACQSHDNLLQTKFKMLHTATSIGRHIVRVSSFDQIAELITLQLKLLNRLCGFFFYFWTNVCINVWTNRCRTILTRPKNMCSIAGCSWHNDSYEIIFVSLSLSFCLSFVSKSYSQKVPFHLRSFGVV